MIPSYSDGNRINITFFLHVAKKLHLKFDVNVCLLQRTYKDMTLYPRMYQPIRFRKILVYETCFMFI